MTPAAQALALKLSYDPHQRVLLEKAFTPTDPNR